MSLIKVLFVDDEENNLLSFRATFRERYLILTAISAADATEILNNDTSIDIVLVDQRMPGMSGVEFLEKIYNTHPDVVRILLTGYADIGAVIDSINKAKIFHYLTKPWSEASVVEAIERGYEYKKSKQKIPIGNLSEENIKEKTIQDETSNTNDDISDINDIVRGSLEISDKINGVLNIKKQAKEFANVLRALSYEEGMMVGLFGRWGRGKTFFWRHVSKNLEAASNQFYKVEFHAWKYQDTPASWAYLYEVLATAFLNKPNTLFSLSWVKYFRNIIKLNFNRKGLLPIIKSVIILLAGTVSFLWFRILSTKLNPSFDGLTWYIGLPLATLITFYQLFVFVKKEYGFSAKDFFLMYTQQHSFKGYLGIQAEIQKEIVKLLQVWIPKKDVSKKRVLIFVDDIDRCNELKIIEIIDALRIMLDDKDLCQRLVVLAAVDERVLKRVISNKYFDILQKDFDESKQLKKINLSELTKEYMDKLFILGIKLNDLSSEGKKQILTSIAENKIKLRNEIIENIGGKKFLRTKFDLIPLENVTKNERKVEIQIDASIGIQDNKDDPRDFDIDESEYETLLEIVGKYENATPRTIRILYYRFLLAKSFLVIELEIDSELQNEWSKNHIDRSILVYLILEYRNMMVHNTREFKVVSQSSDYIEVEMSDKRFVIRPSILEKLMRIIDIVVPY